MTSLLSIDTQKVGQPFRPSRQAELDAAGLEAELRRTVRGEVRFDDGSRALYSTDGSNYRQVPIGVVVPRDVDDAVATVAACRRFGAPVLSRGGGTSLAGQCCNVAVVLDFTKYMRHILELNPVGRYARVQPGCVLDFVRGAAEEHNLTFAPDPSTHNHCTLGGMIGNNSCGVHSIMPVEHQSTRPVGSSPEVAGKTDLNVLELDVLLYDGTRLTVGPTSDDELEHILRGGGRRGEIYAKLRAFRDKYADEIRRGYPHIPRRVSGYNLPFLLPEHGFDVAKALVGSEGTLVMVLGAKVRLVYSPPARSLLVLGYPTVYDAGDHVMELRAFHPTGLEGLDGKLVDFMKTEGLDLDDLKLLPEGRGWLLVEFGGETREESDAKAREAMAALKSKPNAPSMKMYDDRSDELKIWVVREAGLGATAQMPKEGFAWPGWEDSAVPPEKVGPYLRDLEKLFHKHGYNAALYGHFGQGCIHCRIDFDLFTEEGLKNFRSFMEDAADLVVRYGGSLSGEHGDGQARAELLPKMFGPTLIQAFDEFKSIWDPDWKMNPGKVVRPNPMTSDLRLGTNYNPPQVATHFHFPEDKDDFGRVTLRCVGIGECRRMEKETMCPSYRVTHEEMHCTRGRARLFYEMLEGSPLHDGWRSEPVREALDLCLACKGCKGDCPVHVDMATYKAEFLSHYYEGRLRPRHAYAMGLVYWWARLASLMPGVANFFSQTPVLRDVAKWLGGISPRRQMPAFAHEPFKAWFRRRGGTLIAPPAPSPDPTQTPGGRLTPPVGDGKPQVILWPDTFNNYFHPEVGKATVEVLEAAGFHVLVPATSLCCGRPLYDFGMLDTAKGLLRQTLDTLRPWIEAGVPVVGMEPSCVTVFRDELTGLLPHDRDAQRLQKQTFLLSEFLTRAAKDARLPRLHRKAIVHGHCHHKAVLKMTDEQAVLRRLGLDFEVLDDGCCGMAGSFGFEAGKYDVSVAVGELALLPHVRQAPKNTLVISDGFSCQEQILQTTDRRALHLAQVIQMALHDGPDGPAGNYPEDHYPYLQPGRPAALTAGAVLIGAGALLLGGYLLWRRRRRSAEHARQINQRPGRPDVRGHLRQRR